MPKLTKPAPAPKDTPKSLVTTINLHKRLHGIQFKRRAGRAVKEIQKFAQALLRTEDVRIHPNVNKYVWSQGVRHVPYRVRVKLSRKRNEDEDAKSKMYTLVEWVDTPDFHELQTEKSDE